MANHLAIATITATLQRTLQAAVQQDVEGSRVTTVRPSEVGNGTPDTGINIFMYQVITNPGLQNIDAPTFRRRGDPAKRQAALDLFYMFSFYGNDNELAPQRLLGSAVRTLNERRVITPDMIREACRDSTFSYLRYSTLADQVQQINVLPLDLNLEDLSKTWSVFFQTPYMLSVAYKVLVVLIEGEASLGRGLPVRGRRMEAANYLQQPKIEKIFPVSGIYQPILADSTLVIYGSQLKGTVGTQVKLFGLALSPTEVTDAEVQLPLSQVPRERLRAGIQSLQIHHPSQLATEGKPGQRGVESAAAPFVLRPQVMDVAIAHLEEGDEEDYDGEISIELNLPVDPQQRVVMALNQYFQPGESPDLDLDEGQGGGLRNYLFDGEIRARTDSTLTIPIKNVQAGDYLVRLLVDGAESQLEVDEDSERFVGPLVQIPRVRINE